MDASRVAMGILWVERLVPSTVAVCGQVDSSGLLTLGNVDTELCPMEQAKGVPTPNRRWSTSLLALLAVRGSWSRRTWR